MPVITLVHHDGRRDTLDVPCGTSIMHAVIAAGIDGIVGECGGSAMCATCHVYVAEGKMDKLPPVDAVEDAMLDSTACERRAESRLSCQLRVTEEFDGLVLFLPEQQV
jgi:ferredoxin, 2Fe-2S